MGRNSPGSLFNLPVAYGLPCLGCLLQNGTEPVDPTVTRPFRRVYMGGLPDGISQAELSQVRLLLLACHWATSAPVKGGFSRKGLQRKVKSFCCILWCF